jgi:hypothetical protein
MAISLAEIEKDDDALAPPEKAPNGKGVGWSQTRPLAPVAWWGRESTRIFYFF